jgi:heme-degrading monooxygenase HmoA
MHHRLAACIALALGTSTACGSARSTGDPPAGPAPSARAEAQPLVLDSRANPSLEVRIDAFSVPAASRSEFNAAMHENIAFLAKLPGFKGHTVFEKTSGPTTFDVVTLAAWDSPDAMKSAGEKVREHYRAIGFDMQAAIARWGVTASIGSYHLPPSLQ